jgi:DNA polymerase I-like protein with 3'-5' exonuclease and polymerase domains
VYIPEKKVVEQIVKQHMQEAIPLQVPVEVEMSTGSNWLEAH